MDRLRRTKRRRTGIKTSGGRALSKFTYRDQVIGLTSLFRRLQQAPALTPPPPWPPPPLAYAATDKTIAQASTVAHAVNFDLSFNIDVALLGAQPEAIISIQLQTNCSSCFGLLERKITGARDPPFLG
jgi:hypothetical protein